MTVPGELGGMELPEGLERIETDSFSGCGALESLALPSTLRYIGDHAFYACGLCAVTIQGASTQTKQEAFSRNRLSVCCMPTAANYDEQAFDYPTEIVYTD